MTQQELEQKMDNVIGQMEITLFSYDENERKGLIENAVLSAFKPDLKGNQLQEMTDGLHRLVNEKIEAYGSLPKINGWLARDENGTLMFHISYPVREDGWFSSLNGRTAIHDDERYSDITWESGPVEVDVLIRRK